MDNIFQQIFSRVETPFLNSVGQVVASLISYAAAPLQTAVVLYIALTGLVVMRGGGGEGLNDILSRIVKIAVVVWFMTNGSVYATWVQSFFLTVLPNDINHAVASNSGTTTTLDASTFDGLWRRAFQAGLEIWNRTRFTDIGQQMVVILFWAAAMFTITLSFALWFLSHVILGLFVAIGPLLIGLVLFPATRSIFERWIGSLLSCVILQVFVVILATLMLDVENQMLREITSYGGQDRWGPIQMLLAAVLFFGFSGLVLFQLPSAAQALAGGMSFHTGAIARATGRAIRGTGAAAKQTAQGVVKANAAVSGALAGAVFNRIRPSTGGSLSDSKPAA